MVGSMVLNVEGTVDEEIDTKRSLMVLQFGSGGYLLPLGASLIRPWLLPGVFILQEGSSFASLCFLWTLG